VPRMRWGIAALVCLALGGCASGAELVKKNEEAVARGCPTIEYAAEGKCESASAIKSAKREKHDEEVEKEVGEAEKVLKQRHAEELANAAEGR
jgi:hypothetical protein